ncbi:MAG: CBS domain-containing protein [Spirochaetales bacterium]|nr:CBS domain-containing protein [Spirochaetales bacterium]
MGKAISLNSQNLPTVLLDLIFKLKIKDVMSKDVVTGTKQESLRTIQQRMKLRGITGVPIVDGPRLIGIISIDDILNAFDQGHIDDPAEDHMTRNIIVLEDDMPLSFAISYFNKHGFGRFPVLDKKRCLVGIITNRDINTSLLIEVNRIVEQLEGEREHTQVTLEGEHSKQFPVKKHDFEHAGKASTEIKKFLKERQIHPTLIRRIAVASYEMEMNLVVHSDGGRLLFTMNGERIEISAVDQGPGIPDVDKALEVGFSTANEWIRSLGFGAGMGLPNIKRVSDEFSIASDKGTTVRSVIFLGDE